MATSALKPLEMAVLVNLLGGARHGYALARGIEADTDGRVTVLPGNLYSVLSRLEVAAWIERTRPPSGATDARRRYYRVTALGKKRLLEEMQALERQLRSAHERLRALGDEVSS